MPPVSLRNPRAVEMWSSSGTFSRKSPAHSSSMKRLIRSGLPELTTSIRDVTRPPAGPSGRAVLSVNEGAAVAGRKVRGPPAPRRQGTRRTNDRAHETCETSSRPMCPWPQRVQLAGRRGTEKPFDQQVGDPADLVLDVLPAAQLPRREIEGKERVRALDEDERGRSGSGQSSAPSRAPSLRTSSKTALLLEISLPPTIRPLGPTRGDRRGSGIMSDAIEAMDHAEDEHPPKAPFRRVVRPRDLRDLP